MRKHMSDIAIIVLAAGASRRFGAQDKLLCDVAGEPLITRTIRQIGMIDVSACELDVIVVVREGSQVGRRLAPEVLAGTVRLVVNKHADAGMGTSIAAGIASLPATTQAALVVPADMPMLTADVIGRLIAAFIAGGRDRPAHPVLADGTKVGPVVWPRQYFADLMALGGEAGGRSLLEGSPSIAVALDDTDVLADVDTPADLERLVGKLK
jgi:molybdenum cofactor cytidylyltransferase